MPFSAPTMIFEVAKLDAAISQIMSAMDALERGDVIAAITLAGAAEGMLPRPEQRSAFEGLRDHPAVPSDLRENWITIINMDRDWLKHETKELPNRLTIQTDDAAFMIVRALSKLPVAAWNDRMADFKFWYLEWLKTRPVVSRFPERPT